MKKQLMVTAEFENPTVSDGEGGEYPTNAEFELILNEVFSTFDGVMPSESEWDINQVSRARVDSHNPEIDGSDCDRRMAMFTDPFCKIFLHTNSVGKKRPVKVQKFQAYVWDRGYDPTVQYRRQIIFAPTRRLSAIDMSPVDTERGEGSIRFHDVMVLHEPSIGRLEPLSRRMEVGVIRITEDHEDEFLPKVITYRKMQIVKDIETLTLYQELVKAILSGEAIDPIRSAGR